MKPQFRILENLDGKFEVYYVEKITLFGKEILKPFVTWSGLETVYSFSSLEKAIEELKQEVIKQTDRAEYKNTNLTDLDLIGKRL